MGKSETFEIILDFRLISNYSATIKMKKMSDGLSPNKRSVWAKETFCLTISGPSDKSPAACPGKLGAKDSG